MIELKVESYCSNCPDFEPEVEKDKRYTIDRFCQYSTGQKVYTNTTIYCKRRLCCRCLRDSISESVSQEENSYGGISTEAAIKNAEELAKMARKELMGKMF